VLSFVSPVRMGWRIEDVIVIRERIRERMEGGEEKAYIGRTRTVLVGFTGLYAVQA